MSEIPRSERTTKDKSQQMAETPRSRKSRRSNAEDACPQLLSEVNDSNCGKAVQKVESDDPLEILSYLRSLSYPSTSSRKTPKRRVKSPQPPELSEKPSIDFAAILNDDKPYCPPPTPKSCVEGVFDKFIEQDEYASIWRYIPGQPPVSPDRPLTLFTLSPPQKKPKRFRLDLNLGAAHSSSDTIRTRATPNLKGSEYSPGPSTSGRSSTHLLLETPPDPMSSTSSTILSGVTAYVEVLMEGENKSEAVQLKIKSLGGKIAKYFSKKVTHVVFREGRLSTYLKADARKVPIVSVLWIEGSKKLGGPADPALHKPYNDAEFRERIPTERFNRCERFLKRGRALIDRMNGVVPARPSKPRPRKTAKLDTEAEQ